MSIFDNDNSGNELLTSEAAQGTPEAPETVPAAAEAPSAEEAAGPGAGGAPWTQPGSPVPPPPPGGYRQGYTPPPGTYPSTGAPPVTTGPMPGTPVAPPQKTRRVGTITMALCLILIGVLLSLRVLMPNIDYLMIARLSPLVLVLLGGEMLIASARHREEKLRFDFLSVILCLILIGGSLVASIVPEIVYNEYEGRRVSSRLAAELEQSSIQVLQAVPGITYTGVEWYVEVQNGQFGTGMTPQDLKTEHYVQARVRMQGDFATKEEFAEACKRTTDALLQLVPHLDYASFYNYREYDGGSTEPIHFSLWMDNRLMFEYTTQQLAQQVHAEYWLPEGQYYISEEEHQDRLENPRNYDNTYEIEPVPADDIPMEPEPEDLLDEGEDVSEAGSMAA